MNPQQLKFSFKLQEKDFVFNIDKVLNFHYILIKSIYDKGKVLEKFEIIIQSPHENVNFLFDDETLMTRLDPGGNGVILKQNGIDFFKILPNNDDANNVYTIKLLEMSKFSIQYDSYLLTFFFRYKVKSRPTFDC